MNYMKPFFNPIQYISILLLIGFSNIASAHTQATRNMYYDNTGDLTQATDALTNTTSFSYDARGRVTRITNALSQTTQLEYDTRNRITRITYPGGTYEQRTFNTADQLVSGKRERPERVYNDISI